MPKGPISLKYEGSVSTNRVELLVYVDFELPTAGMNFQSQPQPQISEEVAKNLRAVPFTVTAERIGDDCSGIYS